MNGHVTMSAEGVRSNQINGDLVEENGTRMKMDAVVDQRRIEHRTSEEDDFENIDRNSSRKSSAYDESESKTTPSTERFDGDGSRRTSTVSNALSEYSNGTDGIKKVSVENLAAYQNESESAEPNETSDDHSGSNAKEELDRKLSTTAVDEFAILEAQCEEEAKRERLHSKSRRSPIASPVEEHNQSETANHCEINQDGEDAGVENQKGNVETEQHNDHSESENHEQLTDADQHLGSPDEDTKAEPHEVGHENHVIMEEPCDHSEHERITSGSKSSRSSIASSKGDTLHDHSEHEGVTAISKSARSSISSCKGDELHDHSEHERITAASKSARSSIASTTDEQKNAEQIIGGSSISHCEDQEESPQSNVHEKANSEEPTEHETEEEGESQIEIVIVDELRPSHENVDEDAIHVTISHDLSAEAHEKDEHQEDIASEVEVESEEVSSPKVENDVESNEIQEVDHNTEEHELGTEEHKQGAEEHDGTEQVEHDIEELDNEKVHEHQEQTIDDIEPEIEVSENAVEAAAKPSGEEEDDQKFIGDEDHPTVDVETNEIKDEPTMEEESKANEPKIETEQTECSNTDESNQQIEEVKLDDVSEYKEEDAKEVETLEQKGVEEEEETAEVLSPKMDDIETTKEVVDEDNNENIIPDSAPTDVLHGTDQLVEIDDSNNNSMLEPEKEEIALCKDVQKTEASAEQPPESGALDPLSLKKPSSIKTPSKKASSRTTQPVVQKPQSPRAAASAGTTSSRGRARGPASATQSGSSRPVVAATIPKSASTLNRRTQSHSPARPSLEEAMKAAKNVDMRAIFGRNEAHEERKKRREEFIQKKKAEAESKQSMDKEQRRKEAEAAFQCWLQRKASERKRAKSAGRALPNDSSKEITDEEKAKHRDEAQAAFQAWLDRKKDDNKERKRQLSAGVHSQQFISS